MSQAVEQDHAALLREATAFTFKAICGSEPVLDHEASTEPNAGGVQGIIAVIGDLSWSLSLGFAPGTAEAIARKFAGFDIAYNSADMDDVVGELANVMAGDLVARLDRLGHKVRMSLPTVARGQGLHVIQTGAITRAQMCFKLPQGQLWVGLAIGKDIAN